MKYLKLFESHNEIESLCNQYGIRNYQINSDGSVDIEGHVYLSNTNLSELPIQFNLVSGNFYCWYNKLTTLKGCPQSVGGVFNCIANKLTTLRGCPESVGGYFDCSDNQLTTLEGCPESVGGDFKCENNKLTTLLGGPKEVGGDFYCGYNRLTTLLGGPKEVGGDFKCEKNLVYNLFKLFRNYNQFKDSLDFGYLREREIVKSRFREACQEAGIEMPKFISGYNYIY